MNVPKTTFKLEHDYSPQFAPSREDCAAALSKAVQDLVGGVEDNEDDDIHSIISAGKAKGRGRPNLDCLLTCIQICGCPSGLRHCA